MRYSYLRQIVPLLRQFERIVAAYRYSDTGLRIVFDREESWNFEMGRGESTITIGGSGARGKVYQAPFDVLLARRFNRSRIESVALHNNDKIVRITAVQEGSYKSSATILQLEFTGKHTNAIILERDETVLEALRHIDEGVSSRSVRVGQRLMDPPPPPYIPKDEPLSDPRAFLVAEFERLLHARLERLKKEKTGLLAKRLVQLRSHLGALDDPESLNAESQRAQHAGHLVLANMDAITPYATRVRLSDFDGTPVELELPQGYPSAAKCADYFFKRAKKLKQKALGLHREQENLEAKIRHVELFIHTVDTARSPEEISLLFPPKNAASKLKSSDSVVEFWIEGVKVSLGKSEKGNIELLRNAKARDIWMHLKDRPSAHVIISTDKQQLSDRILEAAAKLCVDFSVFEKGRYLVDYTPRREVKLQEGANVLYTNYKTISVDKRGLPVGLPAEENSVVG